MERTTKVNIFLLIIAVGAIIIAIFALNRYSDSPIPMKDHVEDIRVLRDSIKVLKEDIAKYTLEIERINIERERIRQELDLIIKDNEEIDAELANGDWDDNILFLTEFLSEKDTMGE